MKRGKTRTRVVEDACGCTRLSSIVRRKEPAHLKSTSAAFMHVRDNLEELGKVADDTDLLFLKGLLGSPVVTSLVKERLENPPVHVEPVCSSVCDIVDKVCHALRFSSNEQAKELVGLLRGSHLKALLETHDAVVARRATAPSNPDPPVATMPTNEGTEAVRVVGLRRTADEPLGLTVQVDESGNLIIARILGGSTAARQGLLRTGEVILEVNGKEVHNPDQLQQAIQEAKENLSLKVAPGIASDGQRQVKSTCYMRALFDYDPAEDTLLPCREIGLPFQKGDVLQIVDQADPNWWQARRVEGEGLGPPGLIPSTELEERRKAFVPPEADFVHKISICGTRISKKKKRKMYQSKSNGEFDGAELLLYEEVTRMPPFRRKTLALVGPRGVGRRTLKNRLINSDPEKFGTIVPYTSRPSRVLEEDGKSYWFTDRETMERDIREHRYLEYGEHGGHLYGTKLDSVRELNRAGKMCVLDCSPAALKILHNSTEFVPYVIFIAAPGMEQLKSLYDLGRSTGASSRNLTFDRQSSIRYSSRRARTLESLASLYEEDDLKSTLEESAALQRAYEKYIDLVIVNEDFDHTFRQAVAALDALATEHQWVPRTHEEEAPTNGKVPSATFPGSSICHVYIAGKDSTPRDTSRLCPVSRRTANLDRRRNMHIIRQLDVHPKVREEADILVRTFSGAVVTIISTIIMGILFLSEVNYYLTPTLSEELFVDTSRGSKLRINLDIIVPTLSCDLLSIDAMDTTGEQHLQIEHNIFKRRLDLNGKPIEDPQRTNITDTKALSKTKDKVVEESTIEICGDCYGASTDRLKCCNTCEDVREAYRIKKWQPPDPVEIKQCQNDRSLEKMKNAFTQGCQIYGYMEVNRVGGSFHIAPGESFSVNHVHVHDVQPYTSVQFNMTHKIRHLSFGLNIPGKTNPMDDTTVVATEGMLLSMKTFY
ncbi:hypothetical protein KM043_009146 [Ampulex compressa]|nr:hypothetical protein KM043_009146 [Ampulex compressa]